MSSHALRQRIDSLFADVKRLAADPECVSARVRLELETLTERLHDLEKQITAVESQEAAMPAPVKVEAEILPEQPSRQNIRLATPLLYEKEQAGYVYTGVELLPIRDEVPAVSPEKAVIAPLIASGEMIGKMAIEAPAEHPWTQEEASLIEAIARQASQQIENLRLLSAAERSRIEAETATRSFIHEGWDAYLDAIHQSERIGFTYDQVSVSPYTDVLHPNGGVHAPVKVMEEAVGTLYIKPDPAQTLTEEDKLLVQTVADRVAQQVENIRLLADASRARAEAEDAIRRLARENWQIFAADKDESELAFVYDSLQVKPLQEAGLSEDISLSQPLMVSGEVIGQLAVAGWKDVPPEAASMMSSIAAQTNIHLETLRLAEELKKRARELKELDRLKSAFLANMSHELRTPLNSILGFTDVMLEGLDGDLTEYMDNDLRLIQKNGRHLLHLINDVLDMAKIESGRMNLHPEKFKVQNVFEEVTSITSTLASERNTALLIDADSDREIEVYADNTRLCQVMINLVNNSIKFTENGRIVLSAKPMEGARVLITVKDNGIGIPPDHLEAIFQEFTQVDSSTTRKVGGTGLGLPISRRLVEMHGGRLWAESTGIEGEGATLFVELPLEAQITEVVEKQEKQNGNPEVSGMQSLR